MQDFTVVNAYFSYIVHPNILVYFDFSISKLNTVVRIMNLLKENPTENKYI